MLPHLPPVALVDGAALGQLAQPAVALLPASGQGGARWEPGQGGGTSDDASGLEGANLCSTTQIMRLCAKPRRAPGRWRPAAWHARRPSARPMPAPAALAGRWQLHH